MPVRVEEPEREAVEVVVAEAHRVPLRVAASEGDDTEVRLPEDVLLSEMEGLGDTERVTEEGPEALGLGEIEGLILGEIEGERLGDIEGETEGLILGDIEGDRLGEVEAEPEAPAGFKAPDHNAFLAFLARVTAVAP